jgi:hypothetical protein
VAMACGNMPLWRIVEIQRRLTEGKTFTVHRGYDRSPGAKRHVLVTLFRCSVAVQEEKNNNYIQLYHIIIPNLIKADLSKSKTFTRPHEPIWPSGCTAPSKRNQNAGRWNPSGSTITVILCL